MRYLSIKSLLAGLVCFPLISAAEESPNIVVFLVDDMGVMDTSVPFLTDEGGKPVVHPLNTWYQTPNMKRLAKQGVRFSNFYAQSVCSPTRASIMTGQNATRHGTTQFIKPETDNRGEFGPPKWNWKGLTKECVTLPRVLQKNGYRTIHVGKGHFGPFKSIGAEPLNLGFDVNIAGSAIGLPRSYIGTYGKGTSRAVPGLEDYHNSGTFLTDALTIEATKAVDDAVEKKKPFYLYMSHYAVHGPFTPDPRFIEKYLNKGHKKSTAAFAALIEGMDKSLGDLLDHLEKIGEAENTLILFMGDNGTACPGHKGKPSAPLRSQKGSCYEGGTRVPFIAAWAKPSATSAVQKNWPIPAGVIQPQAIGTVMDIFPSVLELTKTPAPKNHTIDGSSLKTLLSGKPDPQREQAFLMHFPHKHRSSYFTSLRLGDWKLIYFYLKENHCELYNLKTDPSESTNLAEKHPKELKRMLGEMKQRLAREDALYPVDATGKELKP